MVRGRQIQFFMTMEDEMGFVKKILQDSNLCLVRYQWYMSEKIVYYNNIEDFFKQPVTDEMHHVPTWLIWDRSISDKLLFRRVSDKQAFYEIVMDINPVIEFSRCIIKNNIIAIGRLAYLDDYKNEEGKILPKEDKRMLRLYNTLVRRIRKESVPSSWDGQNSIGGPYIMPGAADCYEKGGELRQGGNFFIPLGSKNIHVKKPEKERKWHLEPDIGGCSIVFDDEK